MITGRHQLAAKNRSCRWWSCMASRLAETLRSTRLHRQHERFFAASWWRRVITPGHKFLDLSRNDVFPPLYQKASIEIVPARRYRAATTIRWYGHQNPPNLHVQSLYWFAIKIQGKLRISRKINWKYSNQYQNHQRMVLPTA